MMLFQQAKDRAKVAQDRAKSAQDQVKVDNKVVMRTVRNSHRTTGTLLIIVVRVHTFKTVVLLSSALAKTFQLRRKVRRHHCRILVWDLLDGLRTGVLEIVLLMSKLVGLIVSFVR